MNVITYLIELAGALAKLIAFSLPRAEHCAGPFAASAVAVATLSRSVLTCILPLFSASLFQHLNWGPGCSLLAGIACFAIPIPPLLYRYGSRLRQRWEFKA